APFLLKNDKKGYNNLKEFKTYFGFLIVSLILIFFTGLLSNDWTFPIKRGIAFLSIVVSSFFLIRRLSSASELNYLLKGGTFASIVYAFFLLYALYNGNFAFDWEESSWVGKNSSAP